jgi:hypothetical protein
MGIKYGYSDEIKLIGQVRTNIEDLRQWCGDRISLMTSDVSTYAQGRYRLWLFHECNLKTGEITKAYVDDRISQFSQRIYPGCNIGLLTFGGKEANISSDGRIKPHRDHSYAMPIARSINLGSCIFGYGDEQQQRYQLNDGDITEFNCKVLHSVPKIITPERFSIVFWKLNQSKGYLPIQ